MPGQISITIGTTPYSWPIKATNAQIRAALRRHALRRGIHVDAMTEKEVAEAILRAHLKNIRDDSIDQQRMDALAAQQAALEEQLQSDNELYDDPPAPSP